MAQPTPAAGAPAPAKLPGKAGIWIGIVLIVVGIGVGIVLVVGGARSLFDGVSSLQRVPLSGGTIELDEAGRQSVYLERPSFGTDSGFSSGTSSFAPPITVTVRGPGESEVDVFSRSGSETYTWDGREGVLVASFVADEPGTYRVQAVLADDMEFYEGLAIGEALDFGGVAGILGGVFGGGLIILVGVIVIIVSAVRRSRAKRSQQPPYGGYGYGPPGAPAAWGNPGWAPPPVPSPGAAGPAWTPPASPPPTGGTWTPPASPPPASPGWVPPPAPPAPPGPPPGEWGAPPSGPVS
jgi:hypothetical protein